MCHAQVATLEAQAGHGDKTGVAQVKGETAHADHGHWPEHSKQQQAPTPGIAQHGNTIKGDMGVARFRVVDPIGGQDLVPHVIILTAVNVGKFASPNLTPMDFIASKIGMKTRYMITENFPFLFPHMASLLTCSLSLYNIYHNP